jgi:hypothetical protein
MMVFGGKLAPVGTVRELSPGGFRKVLRNEAGNLAAKPVSPPFSVDIFWFGKKQEERSRSGFRARKASLSIRRMTSTFF